MRTIRSNNLRRGSEGTRLFIVHLCLVSGIGTFHYRFPGIVRRHQLIENASDPQNSAARLPEGLGCRRGCQQGVQEEEQQVSGRRRGHKPGEFV